MTDTVVGTVGLLITKLVSALATPLVISLLAMLLGAVLARKSGQRWTSLLLGFGFCVLGIASLPVVAGLAAMTLEQRFPERPMLSLPAAEVAIVLGGATRGAVAPRLEVELGPAGNRILYAARLYRAGKVGKILIAGGAISWGVHRPPESDAIRSLLIEFGVPDADILSERSSRTTEENAKLSKLIWQQNEFQTGLLVTSAIHMPRALALFLRVGLNVTPATTDVSATWPLIESPLDLIPTATALTLFGDILVTPKSAALTNGSTSGAKISADLIHLGLAVSIP